MRARFLDSGACGKKTNAMPWSANGHLLDTEGCTQKRKKGAVMGHKVHERAQKGRGNGSKGPEWVHKGAKGK